MSEYDELVAEARAAVADFGTLRGWVNLVDRLAAAIEALVRERDEATKLSESRRLTIETYRRELKAIESDTNDSLLIAGMRAETAERELAEARARITLFEGAFERLGDECWSLECKGYPIADTGDVDVGYEVISHHQARPTERREGFGRTPLEAMQDAGLLAALPNGGRDE